MAPPPADPNGRESRIQRAVMAELGVDENQVTAGSVHFQTLGDVTVALWTQTKPTPSGPIRLRTNAAGVVDWESICDTLGLDPRRVQPGSARLHRAHTSWTGVGELTCARYEQIRDEVDGIMSDVKTETIVDFLRARYAEEGDRARHLNDKASRLDDLDAKREVLAHALNLDALDNRVGIKIALALVQPYWNHPAFNKRDWLRP